MIIKLLAVKNKFKTAQVLTTLTLSNWLLQILSKSHSNMSRSLIVSAKVLSVHTKIAS